MEYDANIRDFMDNVKEHDKIILYVSDNYLQSVNCMYEAAQALSVPNKIIVILQAGCKIFTLQDKQGFIDFWQHKWAEMIKNDSTLYMAEIDACKIACEAIGPFIDFLKASKRMDDKFIDVPSICKLLGVSQWRPKVITDAVVRHLQKCVDIDSFILNTFVQDLYTSDYIVLSEFPDIPDNETLFYFQGMRLEPNVNGINISIDIIEKEAQEKISMIYPSVVTLGRSELNSKQHEKYYLDCENPSKKQKYIELKRRSQITTLNDEEKMTLKAGYIDTYRLTIHFNSSFAIWDSESDFPTTYK